MKKGINFSAAAAAFLAAAVCVSSVSYADAESAASFCSMKEYILGMRCFEQEFDYNRNDSADIFDLIRYKQTELKLAEREDKPEKNDLTVRIIRSYATQNECFQTKKNITVQGLMLHSVGEARPSAADWIEEFDSPEKGYCVHAFIDADTGDVWQTLPWNHRGWHAGGTANNTHIGVEMCEPGELIYDRYQITGATDPDEARRHARITYNSAVKLFAVLCEEYGLNPLTDIISHREGREAGIASNHSDPEHMWKALKLEYTMDTFRNDVNNTMHRITKVEAGKPAEAE